MRDKIFTGGDVFMTAAVFAVMGLAAGFFIGTLIATQN